LRDIEMQKYLWSVYVGSQGAHKDVKRVSDSLTPAKEAGAEEMLKDFRKC
jgi:hypothetical protein